MVREGINWSQQLEIKNIYTHIFFKFMFTYKTFYVYILYKHNFSQCNKVLYVEIKFNKSHPSFTLLNKENI